MFLSGGSSDRCVYRISSDTGVVYHLCERVVVQPQKVNTSTKTAEFVHDGISDFNFLGRCTTHKVTPEQQLLLVSGGRLLHHLPSPSRTTVLLIRYRYSLASRTFSELTSMLKNPYLSLELVPTTRSQLG